MPTINISVNVTQQQANRIASWFPKWNASLALPYASFNDAMVGILKHQIISFVKTAEPEDIKNAWEAAPQSIKDQVLTLLNVD